MRTRDYRRHRMRCSRGRRGCGVRFTLPRHPDQYEKDITCPECGSEHVHSVEAERREEVRAKKRNGLMCYCSAYPFPHQARTLRMCKTHPLTIKMVEPTDTEIDEYHKIMETQRGTEHC